MVETEVFGTFNIFKCAVPLLKKGGGGSLVAFLTTAVLRTMDYDALNSVPKAAIAMMVSIGFTPLACGKVEASATIRLS